MEAAAADGTIAAVQDVLIELETQDDEVCKWAKQHLTFVSLETQIQEAATEILARFPQLVNPHRSRSVADPFVIALAKVRGLTVVTAERPSGSGQKPVIRKNVVRQRFPFIFGRTTPENVETTDQAPALIAYALDPCAYAVFASPSALSAVCSPTSHALHP
jgi:hypothetical protein